MTVRRERLGRSQRGHQARDQIVVVLAEERDGLVAQVGWAKLTQSLLLAAGWGEAKALPYRLAQLGPRTGGEEPRWRRAAVDHGRHGFA